MKKLTTLLAFLFCFALLFVACGEDAPTPTVDTAPSATAAPTEALTEPSVPPTDPTDPTEAPTDPTELTIPLPTVPGNPLEYHPGSIRLFNQENDDFSFERKYRVVYYTIDGYFFDLLNDEQMDDFGNWLEQNEENTDHGASQNEMLLVSMIKRYDIPREAFDEAVKNYISHGKKLDWDFTHEIHEVPNADVIYTFDNELINYYYRYE